jgi:hypothetical protein
LADGSLVALDIDPPFLGSARLALITLAGRSELPVMSVFRSFVAQQMPQAARIES